MGSASSVSVRVQVRPEPALEVPVWHEMSVSTGSKGVVRRGLFEDQDFPATNESIGGITGALDPHA